MLGFVQRTIVSLALAALTLTLLPGCETPVQTSDEDIQTVQAKQLQDMLAGAAQKKRPTVLVDVRKPERYTQNHIPGAINIPLPELVSGDNRLATATNIVVYGASANDLLTSAAAKKLMSQGYANVYAYRGGLEDWKRQGNRIDSSTVPATQTK